MMSDDENDGQIIFGDLEGLNLHEICLTSEENPEKTSPRNMGGSEGDVKWRACDVGEAKKGLDNEL